MSTLDADLGYTSAQPSGWRPSMSVKPYSRASSAEVTDRWFQRDAVLVGGDRGDAASDVSRRLRYGESRRRGGAVGSVRVQRDVPVLLGDAPVVEHHLRAQPARRHGDRGGAERLRVRGRGCRRAGSPRPSPGRRTPRSGSCRRCIPWSRRSPRRAGRRAARPAAGAGSATVMRWVSMPSRSIRSPSSRSCSQIGRFHVGG